MAKARTRSTSCGKLCRSRVLRTIWCRSARSKTCWCAWSLTKIRAVPGTIRKFQVCARCSKVWSVSTKSNLSHPEVQYRTSNKPTAVSTRGRLSDITSSRNHQFRPGKNQNRQNRKKFRKKVTKNPCFAKSIWTRRRMSKSKGAIQVDPYLTTNCHRIGLRLMQRSNSPHHLGSSWP